MEKFDWEESIKVNIFALKFTGVWPPGDASYKLDFYTLYSIISVTFFIFGFSITEALSMFFGNPDLETIIATAFNFLTFAIVLLKLYYLVINLPMLKSLIAILKTDMFQVKNYRQKDQAERNMKVWKIAHRSFSTLCVISICSWGAWPILDAQEYTLPLPAWFPYDYKRSPQYEITFCYQMIAVSFLATANMHTDTLIAALNTFIAAQCDILADNLKHIHENEDINAGLIDCVKHHRAIVKFAEDGNKFFNLIVLWQFFTSLISLAMSLFQLTVVSPSSTAFITLILYCSAILMQIYLYCWFGNEVELKSKTIPYAVFESDWTGASLEVKKNMVLVTLRTQIPIQISALKLFYLNLETFKTILRSSWSYFTVLKQMST